MCTSCSPGKAYRSCFVLPFAVLAGSYSKGNATACIACAPGQVTFGCTLPALPFVTNRNLVLAVFTLSGLGTVIATLTSLFLHESRRYRAVIASTPPLMQVITLGCLFLYASSALFAFPLNSDTWSICALRWWVTGIALTAVLAALVAKNYRVYSVSAFFDRN